MNFVIISNRMPLGKKPVHLCGLAALLRRFGVEGENIGLRSPVAEPWHSGAHGPAALNRRVAYFGIHSKRSLWDMWELTRAQWRKQVWRLHPDRGGSTKKFAEFSAVHDMIMARLKKKGIFPV